MDYLPRYDYRDVLWAPAKALQAKRIFIATLFLLIGVVLYDIFTYLALAIEGENLEVVFNAFGLLPFAPFVFDNLFAQLFFIVGIVLSVLSVMTGMFGVSAIDTEYIRGNRFFSAREAFKFSVKRFGQLFVSELAIAAFVGVIVLLFILFGLVTRIPVIGDWIFAVVLVFPAFFVSIFTVFIIFVFTLSLILLPAVAAAERHGEAFTSILELFSTVIRQPIRWLLFTAYSLVAAKVCSFVYAYFVYRSVQFTEWASALGGGERLNELMRAGLGHIPMRSDVARETFNIFPGIDFGLNTASWGRGGGGEAAGYLVSFMIFILFASILGYALSVIATAQTRTYMVIRFHKDAHRMGDEDPLFFEPEHINPPIDQEVSPDGPSDDSRSS